MLEVITIIICSVLLVALKMCMYAYDQLSVSELKRQARLDVGVTKSIYMLKGAYGDEFAVFFKLIYTIIAIVAIVKLYLLSGWIGVLLIGTTIALVITWILPASIPIHFSRSLLALLSRPLHRLLGWVHPLVSRILRLLRTILKDVHGRTVHSKEELLELLGHVRLQEGTFSQDELSIAVHALTFDEHTVTEVMTPKSVVKTVSAENELSPVLLSELHASGFSRFPVVSPDTDRIVGVLYMKDLVDMHRFHHVSDAMRPELFYVNEFSSLAHVLNAFLRTQHHLFLVVNEYEEIVGVITIEDVIEQIIGREIVDEFDAYADMREVAQMLAKKESVRKIDSEHEEVI